MEAVSKKDLRTHFSKYEDTLKNLPPSDYYDKILKFIEKKNFLQIMYGMGTTYVLILLDFFEEREDYETCATIRDVIEDYQIVSGKNVKSNVLC